MQFIAIGQVPIGTHALCDHLANGIFFFIAAKTPERDASVSLDARQHFEKTVVPIQSLAMGPTMRYCNQRDAP